jgi:acyl-CoA synthetase (AMP-forming)/AMP-acid ligase II
MMTLKFLGQRVARDAEDYSDFLAGGDVAFEWLLPEDEWDAISINYTSGTTGDSKGVVSHHRGTYLLSQGNALTTSMDKHAVYLWTLPMFHCNGWCLPWTMSAIVCTLVCLRQVGRNRSGTHWLNTAYRICLGGYVPEADLRNCTKKVSFVEPRSHTSADDKFLISIYLLYAAFREFTKPAL